MQRATPRRVDPSHSLRAPISRTSARRPEFSSFTLALAYIPCYYVTVIQAFKNAGTEDVFNGKNTRAARGTCPQSLWRVAARKLDLLDSVTSLEELRVPPGNRLEALSGDRKGQHSIRINDQYRICFVWTDTGPDEVEIVDYH
jgi:proteic killer suppression protein